MWYPGPRFYLNFGGLWTIKFMVPAGAQPHRGDTSHPSQTGQREKKGKKRKNETDCPERRKGKVKVAVCCIHNPERAANRRHVGKRLGKDVPARLSERGTGRVCFVQANRDLAG